MILHVGKDKKTFSNRVGQVAARELHVPHGAELYHIRMFHWRSFTGNPRDGEWGEIFMSDADARRLFLDLANMDRIGGYFNVQYKGQK